MSRNYISGHADFKTAFIVPSYPYGRLRTEMRYWIETVKGKGDRHVYQTLNPKTNRYNAEKKSTYYDFAFMYTDSETGYCHWSAYTVHSVEDAQKVYKFIKETYGLQNIKPEQAEQLKYKWAAMIKIEASWDAKRYQDPAEYLYWAREYITYVVKTDFDKLEPFREKPAFDKEEEPIKFVSTGAVPLMSLIGK